MNPRKILVLTGVVLLLFAFIILFERRMPTTDERQRKGPLHWSIPSDRVDSIRIERQDATFERVLVDVPCTGLGALRRRPEARWRKSPADIPGLGELQRALLRSALAAVRPGGVVGYVTCSPVPAETSDVVRDVVAEEAGDVEIIDAPALLPDVPNLRAAADPRFAQFWPHRHGTDAIFVALLRRAGARPGEPRLGDSQVPS